MKVYVRTNVYSNELERALNEIGYENVLQILNEKSYDGETYNIIYRDKSNTIYDYDKYAQPYRATPWQPNSIPCTPWPNEWDKVYCGDINPGSDSISTNSGVYVHIDHADTSASKKSITKRT